MNKYYILEADGKTPKVVSLMEWAKGFENSYNTRVELTNFTDGSFVSTVFLGLAHNLTNEGAPILWETLTSDEDMYRYVSYEKAVLEHRNIVDIFKSKGLKIGEEEDPATLIKKASKSYRRKIVVRL